MGAIGGGIFQAVKGFRNSPSVTWSYSITAHIMDLDKIEYHMSAAKRGFTWQILVRYLFCLKLTIPFLSNHFGSV